jgi:hypothetical protein
MMGTRFGLGWSSPMVGTRFKLGRGRGWRVGRVVACRYGSGLVLGLVALTTVVFAPRPVRPTEG